MAVISGTVKDSAGNFCARMVRAYRRSDGAFAGEVVSNATTGAYSITALDTSKHYAIVLDGVAVGDPYWNNVVLEMHMDGANGATTFTDAKGRVNTPSGDVSISTAEFAPLAGNSASGRFNTVTASGYVLFANSADFSFGTGNFTYEAWVHPTSYPGGFQLLFDTRAGGGNGFTLYLDGAGKLTLLSTCASASAVPLNQWTHIEVSRIGASLRMFLGGTLDLTVTVTTDFSATGCIIGRTYESAINYFYGYMDDLRITKGVASHTASFTPNASPFSGGTSIGPPTENARILDDITPV